MIPRAALGAVLAALLAGAAHAQETEPGLYARLETSKGVMVLRLHHQHAPQAVATFVGLVRGTRAWEDAAGEKVERPFYTGLTFHRVIPGFMIQGGCPKGDGTGGPGFSFQDETTRSLRHDAAGVLSMANSDPPSKAPWANSGRSNGSQFFITLGPAPHLDGKHTVFGKLIRGRDVLESIGEVETGARDKPVEPVVIKAASVSWVPRAPPPPASKPPDPKKVPGTDQPERDAVRVVMICLQFEGCERQRAHVTRTRDEALELARLLVARCREPAADTSALARIWSDIAPRAYRLVKSKNDPAFAPLHRLQPGQVSEPLQTPYGVVIAEAR